MTRYERFITRRLLALALALWMASWIVGGVAVALRDEPEPFCGDAVPATGTRACY